MDAQRWIALCIGVHYRVNVCVLVLCCGYHCWCVHYPVLLMCECSSSIAWAPLGYMWPLSLRQRGAIYCRCT